MRKSPNYYDVLRVAPDAAPEEIHAAARALSEKFPPETQDPATNPAYRQLVRAYEVLGDAKRRAAYDEQLAQSGTDLLQIEILPSRRLLGNQDTEQLLYLLVNIFPPLEAQRVRQPLNLSLVFDRSTSMRDGRLQRVKAAAIEVIEHLSRDDIISVVMFSDRAEVVVPASHVSFREQLNRRIQRLQAAGGTEIYRGLQAGLQELSRAPLGRYNNHLVLMTDGHTYGDEAECLKIAHQAAQRGITISAFGIGTDWNDNFLDQLVLPAGGHSAYIESSDQIIAHLRQRVSGLGATYAQDVNLTLSSAAAVRCKDAYKLSPFAQQLSCASATLKLGAVEEASPLSSLLELGIRTDHAPSQIELSLDLLANIPSRQIQKRHFRRTLTLEVTPGEPEFSPPVQVLQAVQMLTLHRMNERAWHELQNGEAVRATKRMQRLTSRLMEAGHTKLARQAMTETRRLAHIGSLSEEGRKKLKYGTRSLLTRSMEMRDDG